MAYDDRRKAVPEVWLPIECCPSDVLYEWEPTEDAPYVTVYEDVCGGIWAIINAPPTDDDDRMLPLGCAGLPSAPTPPKPTNPEAGTR